MARTREQIMAEMAENPHLREDYIRELENTMSQDEFDDWLNEENGRLSDEAEAYINSDEFAEEEAAYYASKGEPKSFGTGIAGDLSKKSLSAFAGIDLTAPARPPQPTGAAKERSNFEKYCDALYEKDSEAYNSMTYTELKEQYDAEVQAMKDEDTRAMKASYHQEMKNRPPKAKATSVRTGIKNAPGQPSLFDDFDYEDDNAEPDDEKDD